jgi:hypothetical protein
MQNSYWMLGITHYAINTVIIKLVAINPFTLRLDVNIQVQNSELELVALIMDLSKGKHPTQTTRARARSRWYKSTRGG